MALIVVIEDQELNAKLAAKLLRVKQHEVVVAATGEDGLAAVFEQQPDLVLIDLGLPDIDGQTVIALIRQHDVVKSVPIIAFTAWPPETAHSMAKAYGCDGVITKPIDTRAFADQIAAYLVTTDNAMSEAATAVTSESATSTTADTESTESVKPMTTAAVVDAPPSGDATAAEKTVDESKAEDSSDTEPVPDSSAESEDAGNPESEKTAATSSTTTETGATDQSTQASPEEQEKINGSVDA